MPECKKCGDLFPNKIIIDGILKVINTRKYCLNCSPYKIHNTKCFEKVKEYYCKCGETEPKKFYGNKSRTCSSCHNKYETEKRKNNKIFAVQYKGGKCIICGFNSFLEGLTFHHRDSSKKDSDFVNFLQWNRNRIIKEIDNCDLVCLTCHSGIHSGFYKLK